MDSNTSDDIITMLSRLIEKSEDRIDRTNEMIHKCVILIDKLSGEYVTQLSKLQKARDHVLEENKLILKQMEDRNKEYEVLNKKYDMLVDKMLNINSRTSENNINVN